MHWTNNDNAERKSIKLKYNYLVSSMFSQLYKWWIPKNWELNYCDKSYSDNLALSYHIDSRYYDFMIIILYQILIIWLEDYCIVSNIDNSLQILQRKKMSAAFSNYQNSLQYDKFQVKLSKFDTIR